MKYKYSQFLEELTKRLIHSTETDNTNSNNQVRFQQLRSFGELKFDDVLLLESEFLEDFLKLRVMPVKIILFTSPDFTLSNFELKGHTVIKQIPKFSKLSQIKSLLSDTSYKITLYLTSIPEFNLEQLPIYSDYAYINYLNYHFDKEDYVFDEARFLNRGEHYHIVSFADNINIPALLIRDRIKNQKQFGDACIIAGNISGSLATEMIEIADKIVLFTNSRDIKAYKYFQNVLAKGKQLYTIGVGAKKGEKLFDVYIENSEMWGGVGFYK